MFRPEAHEIDVRAQRIFNYKIPGRIVVRTQSSDDYGIDAELELFLEGQSTGIIFKVQLKGQRTAKTNDGKTISYSFPVRKAMYLIEQIEIPTIFVLVDVTTESVYWCDIQSNQALIDSYRVAQEEAQESFTFYFPTQNVIPHTLPQLFEAIASSANNIAFRRVANVPSTSYAEYLSHVQPIDNELSHLTLKIDIANAIKLRRLIGTHSYNEAENLINSILASVERSHEAKFDAMLYQEQIFVGKYGGQREETSLVEFNLNLAEQLTQLANNASHKKLDVLAKAFTLYAKLFFLVHQDMQLFHNWSIHNRQAKQDPDYATSMALWLSILQTQRSDITKQVLKAFEALMDFIPQVIEESWVAVPDIVTRVILSLNILFRRLREEGLSQEAVNIQEHIKNLIEFVVGTIKDKPRLGEWDAIFDRCAIAYQMQIAASDNKQEKQRLYTLALSMIDHISNQEMKKIANARLEEEMENKPLSTVDWEVAEKFYRTQAKALGIDLSLADRRINDVNHPSYWAAQLAWLIEIGIRDINPTRILKNCTHMIYDFDGGIGEPARRMNLSSARRKVLGCVLHLEHGAISHHSLDAIYQKFQGNHCSKCSDIHPHDPSWQYTEEWHRKRIQDWQQAHTKLRQEKGDKDD